MYFTIADDIPQLFLNNFPFYGLFWNIWFQSRDGLGRFIYNKWQIRGMVKDILDGNFYDKSLKNWYLTTGRTLAHYNNSAQTKETKRLLEKYPDDVVLAPISAKDIISDKIMLKTKYGQSEALDVVFSDKIRDKTLFCTFHHAKSKINALFGDECDEDIMTARFKSLKVEIINISDSLGCS